MSRMLIELITTLKTHYLATVLSQTVLSRTLLILTLLNLISGSTYARPFACAQGPITDINNIKKTHHHKHIDAKVWQQLTLEQQCYLLQLTELRVQNDIDYPPFNYLNNNQPTGYSIDYMKLIAKKLGVDIKYHSNKLWRDYLRLFKQGELDILINIAINEPRKQWLNYTDRYIQISYAMAVHQSNSLKFQNINPLEPYRIAIVDQSASGDAAINIFKNSTILAFDDLEQAIQAIVDKKADTIVYAGVVIKHHLEQHNISSLKLITPPKVFRQSPINMAIATAKDNLILRDILNVAMSNISANQLIDLRNKWHIVDSQTTGLDLSKQQRSYLNQIQKLTVGGFNNNRPLNFTSDDKPKGYAIDILNNISAILELEIDYLQEDKTLLTEKLINKKVDILINASPQSDQHQDIRFTQPYLTQRHIIVQTNAKTPDRWVQLKELSNRNVAVVSNSSIQKFIQTHYPQYQLIIKQNHQLAIDAVISGTADAAIISESQAKYLDFSIQSENLKYQLLNMPDYNTYDTHAIAVHKDNEILHSIIEKALAAIPKKRLQDIKKQWFNNQIPINQHESPLNYKQRQWLLNTPHLSLYLPNWHLPLGGATQQNYHGVLADLTSYVQQQINYHWLGDTNNSPYIANTTDAQIIVTTASDPQFKHTHLLSNTIDSDPIVMLTNNPDIKILTSNKQIAKLKLGVFNHPPLPSKLFSQYIQKDYQSYNDMSLAIQSLRNNQFDILFCPISLCTYYMNQIQDKSIRIVGQTNYHQQIVFAINRQYAPMVGIINDVLKNMSAQHKNATYQRWNQNSTTINPPNYEVIFQIIVIAFIFLIVGLAIIEHFQHKDKALETEQHAKSLQQANQELTNAQSKLIAAEKMAALGSLTAGIAHEINNPTNSVHLGVENLEFEIDKIQQFFIDLASEEAEEELIDSFKEQFIPLLEHINTIVDGTSRIKTIVEDLRAFTRLDAGEKKPTQINAIIQSTINLIKAKYKHNTEFITQFANIPKINVHSGQLNQVFMNLLVNACDAIEESQQYNDSPKKLGKIIITTALQQQQLFIIVQDNGCGMSEQTSKKIFEPFYTTKPVGKGTGLGMAISFGIIKDHGGSMDVCSTLSQGTSITITIPIEDTA